MGSGTITAIDTSRWPGHVGSVIIGIEVDTIPTVGEVDLSSDTLRTFVVGKEAVPLIPVGVTSVGTGELETDIGDCFVASRSIKVPSIRLTGKHSKTVGESKDFLVLVSRSRKVVGVHVVDGYHGVGSIGRVVMVELRDPVVGLVLSDCRGGTTTGSHRLVGDTLGEPGSTSNGVNVTRDRSWIDDTV